MKLAYSKAPANKVVGKWNEQKNILHIYNFTRKNSFYLIPKVSFFFFLQNFCFNIIIFIFCDSFRKI